jgi:hypothetical protein
MRSKGDGMQTWFQMTGPEADQAHAHIAQSRMLAKAEYYSEFIFCWSKFRIRLYTTLFFFKLSF